MNSTWSRRNASASSVASRRWPKWIGSNVPPNKPSAWPRDLPALSSATSAAHVAVAQDDPLLRREPLEAHGTARVQLVGGDADLRAEAVLEAVRETRRGVHHDRARVHLAQETAGARPVLGDDRIGMLRAVF